MNFLHLKASVVLALLLALGAPAVAAPIRLSAAKIAAVEALIHATMARHRIPGATFAIGVGGRLAWAKGFGYADLENRVRAGPDTAYRTASIGKAMAATAALKLAEEGRLDLDAPVQAYCPRFPPKTWTVTARDLISHTSGVRHYGGPREADELYNTRHYDQASDAVDLFKDDPLQQKPGAEFLYSTWGYVLLGCVIEGASGQELRAHMHDAIFRPSGMSRTRDDDPRAVIPNRARGYLIENSALKVSRAVDMSSKLAAGGWITTAPDLVRFMDAWMAGRLVGPATMSLMLEPYRLRNGDTVDNFGMGWFVDDYHGLRAGLYGGGTPQVSGVVFFVPKARLAVAGVFNLEDIPGPERIALAEAIADVILGYARPNPGHFGPG